jgi:hypothetical protein
MIYSGAGTNNSPTQPVFRLQPHMVASSRAHCAKIAKVLVEETDSISGSDLERLKPHDSTRIVACRAIRLEASLIKKRIVY